MKNLFAKLLAALLIATLLLTPVASLAEEMPAVEEAAPAADAAPADDDDEEEVLIAAEPVDEIIAEAAEESVDLIAGEADLPEEEYIDLVTDEDADFALFGDEIQTEATQTYKIVVGTVYIGGAPGGPNTTEVTVTPWIENNNGVYQELTEYASIPAGAHVYFKHNYTGDGNTTISELILHEEGGPDSQQRYLPATKSSNTSYDFEADMPVWNVGYYTVSTSFSGPSNPSGPTNLQPTIKTKPTAKDLTYNGKPQELLDPGTAENGYFMYWIGAGEPSEDIPTATEAGTYEIHYGVYSYLPNVAPMFDDDFYVTATIASAPAEEQVTTPSTISPAPAITIAKVPAKVKAKAAKKGKVTVSWKKIKKTKKTKALLKQIKGIEVQISTDPTFATNVQTKNLGKKKTKATFKKLQKKTRYYVRVRYIDGVGGVSNWSKVKGVKTKKK